MPIYPGNTMVLHHRGRITRLARSILLLYATIYYLVPMLLTILFGQPLEQILAGFPNYFLGSAFITIVIVSVWFFCGKFPAPDFIFLGPLGRASFHRSTVLAASLIYFGVAYLFAQQYGLSFRQTGDRISQAGGLVIVLLALQNYLLAVLLLYLGLSAARVREEGWQASMSLALIAAGSLLSLAASSGVVAIAISLLLLTRSVTSMDLLTSADRRKNIATIAFFAVAGALALFVGIANKRGVDATIYLFTKDIESIIAIFQARISYHFYSASYHTTFNFFNFDLGTQAFRETLLGIGHRYDVLMGNPTFSNEIASVNRLNYEQISLIYRERTGISPGLVGGMYFVPGGILALPLSILLVSWILLMISKAAGGRSLSLFGLAYLALYLTGVADSSIDLVNPFNTPFLKFVLLILVCAWQTQEDRLRTPAKWPTPPFGGNLNELGHGLEPAPYRRAWR